MRTLEFNVSKQRLIKRPGCDFSGLVAGSVGYLQAKFYFSEDEWGKCSTKIASFWINDSEQAICLDENNTCSIPPEITINRKFDVSVVGGAPGYRIKTNKICVRQGVD